MARKVLVLNADFKALTICSVTKAFLLVYTEKAELVHEVENQQLRSISRRFPMPSVIRLYGYVSIPYKGVMLSRQNVFKRDNNRCLYCSATDNLTLDHVLPRSRGGQTTWTNLVTACRRCNSKKGDLLPEEAKMPLPYKPFKPSFILFTREFSGAADKAWIPFLQTK
ncbi:MAG: HNH endonuclease [Bacteroidetes bacterium]|nr:MAG: HNH endonuclease [Bacteroidota bacterium]